MSARRVLPLPACCLCDAHRASRPARSLALRSPFTIESPMRRRFLKAQAPRGTAFVWVFKTVVPNV